MLTYKITGEQEAYLNSLTCQRLSADPINKMLVQFFGNPKNRGLASELKQAYNVDKRGETAYYIIKNQDNDILLYFSLRCGTLHRPGIFQRVRAEHNKAKALYQASVNKKAPKWAQAEVEEYKINGILPAYVKEKYLSDYLRMKNYLDALKKDAREDPTQKMIQTEMNYSGVEMVHFCVNEYAKTKWNQSLLGHCAMGQTMFWYFVLPIIQAMNRLVGCEYVYLFAADSSPEQTLVNYYYEKLHFTFPEGIATAKPGYDIGCAVMCQKLSILNKYQTDFLKNLNRPEP